MGLPGSEWKLEFYLRQRITNMHETQIPLSLESCGSWTLSKQVTGLGIFGKPADSQQNARKIIMLPFHMGFERFSKSNCTGGLLSIFNSIVIVRWNIQISKAHLLKLKLFIFFIFNFQHLFSFRMRCS